MAGAGGDQGGRVRGLSNFALVSCETNSLPNSQLQEDRFLGLFG